MATADFRSGVYEIVNSVNGKRYVGSAVNFRLRFRTHLSLLRSGKHHSRKLQSAWKKHGEAAFVFRPILVCAPAQVVLYEQIAMDALLPEYNICKVAGSAIGLRWTEEAREAARVRNALSNPFKGRTHSPEARALIAAAKMGNVATKGKRRSAEAVEKTAAGHRGAKRSAETRARIAAAALGRKRTPESVEAGAAKLRGIARDPEHVAHLLGNKHAAGKQHPQSRKEEISKQSREMWSDPMRRAEILAAQAASREKRRSGQ
jgi:group I intron endonuclease